MPHATMMAYLEKHPNARKAAPEGMTFVFDKYLGKYSVNIDTRFKVERIMWTGILEEKLVALARKRVRPDDIAFDIGSNVGAISIALADAVGDEGEVHAFEPNPANYARLKANLALNPSLQNRVITNNLGLGSEPGTLYWHEDSGNPGNGNLDPKGDVACSVVTLDSYCENNDVRKLDFMKVDVEGMELAVFKGGEKTLSRLKPIIYFETLGRFSGPEKDNFQAIETFLLSLGYKLHKLHPDGSITPSSIKKSGSYTVAIA